MNKIVIIIFLGLCFSFNAYSQKHTYENNNIKCTYELKHGRLHGDYMSYYKNGQKKSEGKFENNYRTGLWTVWDSLGCMRMQREYENPFVIKRIIPETPKDKSIELLNTSQYKLEYNKDGYIEYFKLQERMVVLSKRVWRYLSSKYNPDIFEDNKLFKLLNDNILKGNITAYDVSDKTFQKEYTLTKKDVSIHKLIGYKIKEEYFFDNERLVSETRTIAITPVVVNKVTGDTLDLYMLYFPSIREYLAKEKVQSSELPENVKTLDDLFFFRCFTSHIYKKNNYSDSPNEKYNSGSIVHEKAERIEMFIIDVEHDIWISLTQ